MPDLNAIRAAVLAREMRRHFASPVIYSRGSASATLSARRGRSEHQVTDVNGITTAHESDDFFIDAADLRLDGVLIQPAKGDRIVPMVDGEAGPLTFEVLPPPGVPCFVTDSQRVTYRIHTKLIQEDSDE